MGAEDLWRYYSPRPNAMHALPAQPNDPLAAPLGIALRPLKRFDVRANHQRENLVCGFQREDPRYENGALHGQWLAQLCCGRPQLSADKTM